MTELEKLASKLYAAYNEYDDWEEFKEEFPILVGLWMRVAQAAVDNIVVIKII